jgi:hypothetical protein
MGFFDDEEFKSFFFSLSGDLIWSCSFGDVAIKVIFDSSPGILDKTHGGINLSWSVAGLSIILLSVGDSSSDESVVGSPLFDVIDVISERWAHFI